VDDEASGESLPPTYGRTSVQPRPALNRIKVIANRVAAGIGIAILVVVIFVATAVFIDNWVGEEESSLQSLETAPLQSTAIAGSTPFPQLTPTPIGYVDLREMLNLYEANDVAAEHRYEGKRVVIDGIIHEINKEYFDIIPRGSDLFQMSGARCYSHPDRFSDVLELKEGQHITIRGTHDGLALDLFLTKIKVKDCDF
jgi:hypothetical protein